MVIGINLSSFAEYTESPFVDLFRSISQPIPGGRGHWDDGGVVNTDKNGYPNALANGNTVHFVRFSKGITPGQYYCLYEGTVGELSYVGDISFVSTIAKGKDLVNITPSLTNQLFIYLTNAGTVGTDYIRNIRLIPVSAEQTYLTHPFNLKFLDLLRGYDTLRFMDPVWTNNTGISANWNVNPPQFPSIPTLWKNRSILDQITWTPPDGRANVSVNLPAGMPVELIVQLCNELESNMWVNMPTTADDDYITQFATYVKANLNPNLKVYVEYSNEVWNGAFLQQHYAEDQGKADPEINANPFIQNIGYAACWYTKRTQQVLVIWESVFGSGNNQIIGVLGSQAVNAYLTQYMLTYAQSNKYGLSNIKAVAVAPYFGADAIYTLTDAQILAATDDQLAAAINTELTRSTYPFIEAQLKALESFSGIELIAYEGGQSILPNTATLPRLSDFQKSAQMGKLYEAYLNKWYELTKGNLFLQYHSNGAYGTYGCWGIREFLDDPITPKEAALRSFISHPPIPDPVPVPQPVPTPQPTPVSRPVELFIPTALVPTEWMPYIDGIAYSRVYLPVKK